MNDSEDGFATECLKSVHRVLAMCRGKPGVLVMAVDKTCPDRTVHIGANGLNCDDALLSVEAILMAIRQNRDDLSVSDAAHLDAMIALVRGNAEPAVIVEAKA